MIDSPTKKTSKFGDIYYNICVVISFVLMCVLMFMCTNASIWRDEAFTYNIINGSYVDVIVNTAHDVHPPIFYLIYKFGVETMTLLFPGISTIILGKFVAIFGFIAVYYFAINKLSKCYSKFAVGTFLLLLFAFPCLNDITLLARMYGWCVFFVLCAMYYAVQIIRHGKKKDWALFVLFFELAAYTHNFALVAVSGLYLYLFIYFLANNRKKIKTLLLCGVVALAIYLPWLVVLLKQFASIHNNYWIQFISVEIFNQIFAFNIFPISNVDLSAVVNFVICIICMFVEFIVGFKVLIDKDIKREDKWQAFAGIFATAFVYVFGIAVSMILDPIFEKRYAAVMLGMYHISFLQVAVLYYKAFIHDSLQEFCRVHKSGLKLCWGGGARFNSGNHLRGNYQCI